VHKRSDGGKTDTNILEHQKRDEENNNIGFGKVQNNKHRCAEVSNTQLGIS
jgi:hypothetical protein